MKCRLYLSLIIVYTFSVIGCSNTDKTVSDSAVEIVVDISNAEAFDLSDKGEIVDVVALELTDNSILSGANKVTVTDDYILVVDQYQVFLFDRKGKFIRKIGNTGSGPGEYLILDDVKYDGEFIYMHDRLKHTMHIREVSGDLVASKVYNQWLDSFCKTEDGFWIYAPYKAEGLNPEGYILQLLDNNFETVQSKFLPQKEFFPTTNVSRFYNDADGNTYFAYPFSNIIYQLKDKTIIPKYVVDFKSNTMPYDQIKAAASEPEYKELAYDKGYQGDIIGLVFCNDKIYFDFSEASSGSSRGLTAMYDIETNTTKVFDNYYQFKPKSSGKYPFKDITFIHPVGAFKDQLIFSMDPIRFVKEDRDLIRAKLATEINENSNPVLVFVKDL